MAASTAVALGVVPNILEQLTSRPWVFAVVFWLSRLGLARFLRRQLAPDACDFNSGSSWPRCGPAQANSPDSSSNIRWRQLGPEKWGQRRARKPVFAGALALVVVGWGLQRPRGLGVVISLYPACRTRASRVVAFKAGLPPSAQHDAGRRPRGPVARRALRPTPIGRRRLRRPARPRADRGTPGSGSSGS